jgi:hypothetical protein
LETYTDISPNQIGGINFLGEKLTERERLVKWSNVMDKVKNIVFIYNFDMQALFEPFMPLKNILPSCSFSPQPSQSTAQFSVAFFHNFTQNLMLILRSQN